MILHKLVHRSFQCCVSLDLGSYHGIFLFEFPNRVIIVALHELIESFIKIPTLLGQDLYIHRKNGQQRVNNSAINCMGVRTDNGMVWLIDSVLMPQS